MLDQIQIVSTPLGEAPLWVRKAWLGMTLTLTPGHPIIPENHFCAAGVVSGRQTSMGGYSVEARDAVEELRHTQPEAAEWWDSRPRLLQPGYPFIFNREACELIPASLDKAPGVKTVEDFYLGLRTLPESEQWLIEIPTYGPSLEWGYLMTHRLCRIAILLLARILHTNMCYAIAASIPEDCCVELSKQAHAFLAAMEQLAREEGIFLKLGELDGPVNAFELTQAHGSNIRAIHHEDIPGEEIWDKEDTRLLDMGAS